MTPSLNPQYYGLLNPCVLATATITGDHIMLNLRRKMSFRRKSSAPPVDREAQALKDKERVRNRNCYFRVKYIGWVEVFQPVGMRICEEAADSLRESCKKNRGRSFLLKQSQKREFPIVGVLHITPDSLRFTEDLSIWGKISSRGHEGLVIDQAVDKVSFCAPDRFYSKGFSYICRDSVTRKWMCHSFHTIDMPGERLSYAIGCAFSACFAQKKAEEAVDITVVYSGNRTCFERQGSFRQASLTERQIDPQCVKIPEARGPPSEGACLTPTPSCTSIERPRASMSCLIRQESALEFASLNRSASAFKRTTSLRLAEFPSKAQNETDSVSLPGGVGGADGVKVDEGVDGLADSEPTTGEELTAVDAIASMCQQLSTTLFDLQVTESESLCTTETSSPYHRTTATGYPTPSANPFLPPVPQRIMLQ